MQSQEKHFSFIP